MTADQSSTLKKAEKASHSWTRWLVVGAITLGFSYLLASTFIANRQITNALPQQDNEAKSTMDTDEKEKIDAWIKANNLNDYGDPADTAYTGGTPLFNEATGESIDKYEYIINKFPDKPWNR